MATRQSVDEHLQRSEQAYEFANEQFMTASKQEHYNDNEYSDHCTHYHYNALVLKRS